MADEFEVLPPEDPGESRYRRFEQLMESGAGRSRAIGRAQSYAARAQQQSTNEQLTRQRFAIQQGGMELRRMQAVAELQKQRAVIQHQMEITNQTANAFESVGKLDPSGADYNLKLAEIFHQNPSATKDPILKELLTSQLHQRQIRDTTGEEIIRHEESQASLWSRIHGSNVIRDKDGRIDWEASEDAADARHATNIATARKAGEDAAVAAGLKPHQMTITDKGVSEVMTAPRPDLPDSVNSAHAKVQGDLSLHKSAIDQTTAALAKIDPKSTDADVLKRRADLESTLREYTARQAGAQAQLDSLTKSYPQLSTVATPAPAELPSGSAPIKMKFDPSTGSLVPQ